MRHRRLCRPALGPGGAARRAEKLEYRGYDSAGISIQTDGQLDSVRAVGQPRALRDAVEPGATGDGGVALLAPPGHHRHRPHALGHPRPRDRGERPPALRHRRTASTWSSTASSRTTWSSRRSCWTRGAAFTSETDVEVIAHLVADELDAAGDLAEAVRRTYLRLRGHYAFVAVAADEPGSIVGARKECPLVVGRGDGEQFLGLRHPRLPRPHAPRPVHRERRDRRRHRRRRRRVHAADGDAGRARRSSAIDWDAEEAEKGGYETFMLKEIHEQADAVAETIADRTAAPTASTSRSSTTRCCAPRAGS